MAELPAIKNQILGMLEEVDSWIFELKDFNSSTINLLGSEIKNAVSSVREKVVILEDGKSVEIFQEAMYDILTFYRYIFSNIQNILMLRVPQDNVEYFEEYKNIPNPQFSFSTEDKISYIENILQIVPIKMTKVEAALMDLYTIQFTKSLRLWDMCKPHPRFEDYIAILWNTPKFISFISPYMTENQLNSYKDKYRSNRQLFDYGFKEAPFYFGRVLTSHICEEKQKQVEEINKILREMKEEDRVKARKKINVPLCNKDCANCPFKFKDLSYTDRLAEMSDDDDDSSDGFENTKEYKEATKTLEALGKILTK